MTSQHVFHASAQFMYFCRNVFECLLRAKFQIKSHQVLAAAKSRADAHESDFSFWASCLAMSKREFIKLMFVSASVRAEYFIFGWKGKVYASLRGGERVKKGSPFLLQLSASQCR